IAPDAQITFYATGSPEGGRYDEFAGMEMSDCRNDGFAVALRQAIQDGNQIISISQLGGWSPTVVAQGIKGGVLFVSGVPNLQEHVDRDERGPSAVAGVVAVGAVGEGGRLPVARGAVVEHRRLTVRAPGEDMTCQGDDEGSWSGTHVCHGTSYATPVVAGALALAAQKYPEATSNQLVAALLSSSSGGGLHDPVMGYGVIDVMALLETDPMVFDKVNPLLSEAVVDPRFDVTAQRVRDASLLEGSFSTLTTATPTPVPGPGPVPGGLAGWVWPTVGGLVAVLVLGTVVVVMVSRRGRKGPGRSVGDT
ncbi:MAG: S8 family serine peptidase, partial [Micrococcales bacterium]|nr:S8 family serine peptidase [Micrococcales bacterium]